MVPYERIMQDRGKDTFIHCIVEGNPLTQLYWEKDGEKLEEKSGKFTMHTLQMDYYKSSLGAMVYNLEEGDFGEYTCVAGNDEFTANGTVTLYGKIS